MTRSRRVRHLALATAFAAALVAAVGAPRGAIAASPSAAPAPSAPACQGFVTWADEPLPRDVPAGRQIPLGVTVWDCDNGWIGFVDGAEVRVHPKTGTDVPAVFRTRSDWPGHLITTIEVPAGGLGAIEFGSQGRECHADGSCVDVFAAFGTGGVGPPPGAPPWLLVEARIVPQLDPIQAGHAFDVEVDVEPRAPWPAGSLVLPDRMVIEAQVARGDSRWRADARSASGTGGPYTGQLVVDEPGDFVLHAGFPVDGGDDVMIDGLMTRITIEPGDGTRETPGPGADGPIGADGSLPPVVPIAAGLLAVVALALVVRRVFADL